MQAKPNTAPGIEGESMSESSKVQLVPKKAVKSASDTIRQQVVRIPLAQEPVAEENAQSLRAVLCHRVLAARVDVRKLQSTRPSSGTW